MWSLFAAVQPKSNKPIKSLKEVLLIQEMTSLNKIEEYAAKLLNSVNDLLKKHAQNKKNQSELQQKLTQYENAFESVYKKIMVDNQLFKESVQQRDFQKVAQQDFFKTSMKSYQQKRKELNQVIVHLQQKVQALQQQGYATYQYNPKPHHILSGINKNYIEKYLSKLQDSRQIQKFFIKNQQNNIYKQEGEDAQNQNLLSQLIQNCKVDEIQTKLKQILLKEQLKKEMLVQKVNKNRAKFTKFAREQKLLKEGVKNVNAQIEFYEMQTKINENYKNMGIKQYQNYLRMLKKNMDNLGLYHCKEVYTPQQQELNQLNQQPVFKKSSSSPSLLQKQKISQSTELYTVQLEQGDCFNGQSLDQQFMEACQMLITDRFMEDQSVKAE